jgi:muramoyltetrapeptide carboxypeptidase
MQKKVRIGIVAPARRLEEATAERLNLAVAGLEPSVELKFHPHCFLAHGHFAGTDAQRTTAVVDYANDPTLDALWFARGGYGTGRIAADVLNQLGPSAGRKTYLGYSDCGFLLAGLYHQRIGQIAHGPLANDILREGGTEAVARGLAFLARGDSSTLESSLRAGIRAVAFNLTVLCHLLDTPLMPDLTGHVLALEETSEPLYRIDRSLGQLAQAGSLRKLAGVRLGRISDVVANDVDFGQSAEECVKFWCAKAAIPYLGIADIGHDVGNKIVVFGGRVPEERGDLRSNSRSTP